VTRRRRAAFALLAAGAFAFAGASAAPAPSAGEQVYDRCLACHALAYDRVGPRHCGLFGRRAGSVPGFVYSPVMKGSGIVWNAKTLDWFLAAPMQAMPGTAMTYDGIADAGERGALIAYLERAGRSAECRG
jgi:cytochrome c